jgi:CBS domain-containing protein
MEIGSVMKRKVVTLPINSTLEQAIEAIIKHRVGLIPLLDQDGTLKGIINLRHILKMAWPRALDLLEDIDFVHDFGALESGRIQPEQRQQLLREHMEAPLSVETDCGLLRAAAFMSQHRLRDLPIVDQDSKLVGLASWVDVGAAYLQLWTEPTIVE